MSVSLQPVRILKKNQLIYGISNSSIGNIDTRFGNKKQALSNREKLASLLGIKTINIYEMEQVHGSKIEVITQAKKHVFKNKEVAKTDGLITNIPGIYLMVKTADCFPVLMVDLKNRVIAAVHVGWRGAIQKNFLTALIKMMHQFSTKLENVLVGIGPGIEACCFKHKSLIQKKLPEWIPYIKKDKNNWKSLDLKKFIIDNLKTVGVLNKNIETTNICTNCSSQYFSHFKSLQAKKPEARFATIIGLKN
ncbi:polyphenol oxidase family protein [Patescibacteria group bacterium]